jgi:ParB family chromosome partitioning protein
VKFIGLDAYTGAGGYVMRDLFSTDAEGWLQDPALVEQLVGEKLATVANEIAAEGWKWVEAAIDLPYGCEHGKRRIASTTQPLTDEEQARLDTLVEEYDAIGEQYRDDADLPDDVDARLTEIDAEMTPLVKRPVSYDPDELARAGVFIALMHDGRVRIDRGYVRIEDEPVSEDDVASGEPANGAADSGPTVTVGGQVQDATGADEEDDTIRPLPDRLVAELTAERTLALRDALANAPDAAFLALLHALCLSVFRSHGVHGCLQIGVTQSWLGNAAPNLRDTVWSNRIQERQEQWAARLPNEPDALWSALAELAHDDQMTLLAHCVSLGVNALFEAAKPYDGRISAHSVTQRKPRIIEAVREARGDATAVLIEHLKKGDMAREAERLLEGTGWLPEPLRLLPVDEVQEVEQAGEAAEDLPDFLLGDDDNGIDDEADHMAIAAE